MPGKSNGKYFNNFIFTLRQAFPCWDEPAVKATFDMVIVAPKNRVVLSNMPEIESSEDPEDAGCNIVKFATSPVMSTYLVAVVVGEFDYIEDKTSEGINVRVYSPLGKKEQGRFALECAVKSLTFYSEFFNIPYPLAKYDMIAIPDFSSGAMENWGLVLYRETCILVDPANSSQSSKQWVAIVVCHETAHQWFGERVVVLVTSSKLCVKVTSSPWSGGHISGSTRGSPPSWRTSPQTPSTPSTRSGSSSSLAP